MISYAVFCLKKKRYAAKINLSSWSFPKIFKLIQDIAKLSESEMLKTFNCGVGFCLITDKKNINKIKNIFSKNFQPYEIGFISNEKSKVKTFGKLKW